MIFMSYRLVTKLSTVDSSIARWFSLLTKMSLEMLMKLGAVVLISPIFIIPGVIIAVVGAWVGEIYMKAQLAVKRERSNAKAPVLGHFGAAFAGLGTCCVALLDRIMIESVASLSSCIWSSRRLQEGIIRADQPIHSGNKSVLFSQLARCSLPSY